MAKGQADRSSEELYAIGVASGHDDGAVAPPTPVRLEGAGNFRDIGGILTEDGRRVRKGKVFRSNRLSQLTDNDQAVLDSLGIVALFDLRGRGERETDPTCWAPPGLKTHVFRTGHKRRLIDMASDYPRTRIGSIELMQDFYREMPKTMGHVFAGMIQQIAAGDIPCVIHCSAGKDRTGAAVAILLSALGVPKNAIVEDYVRTASVPGLNEDMKRALIRPEDQDRLSQYPAEAIAATMDAIPDYIEETLNAVYAKSKSLKPFLDDIGVAEEVISDLKARLLES